MSFDVIVLAGGAGRRLGGRDKAKLVVGGVRLLDRVLASCADADSVVVVGPERATPRPVVWVREDPPGGGPCAALATGVAAVRAPVTVLLAVDLPHVDAPLVNRLAGAAPVVAVDGEGRDQWLLSAWPTSALLGLPASGSLGAALGPLPFARLPVGAAADDIDTPDDLRRGTSQGAC